MVQLIDAGILPKTSELLRRLEEPTLQCLNLLDSLLHQSPEVCYMMLGIQWGGRLSSVSTEGAVTTVVMRVVCTVNGSLIQDNTIFERLNQRANTLNELAYRHMG